MMVSTITNKMNTQAIRDELSEFVYSNFDADDMEILNELSEVFVQSHSCLLASAGEQTMDGAIATSGHLNLDDLQNLVRFTDDHRSRQAKTILKYLDASLIEYTPGTRQKRCQMVFKTYEAFVMACMCLQTPRAKLVSKFSAKCNAMVVRLHVALQKDLKKTKAELAEERAQVQRRVFLVVKEAVREARREMGLRYTDCSWRLKNFTKCCQRMKGLIYYQSNTPYIQKNYLRNAHESMKFFYGLCQRNPVGEQPHYTQTKLSDNFV